MLPLVLSACFGSRQAELPPDDRFGHRYEQPPDARRTITIEPPAADVGFFTYPAIVDSVHVRPAPLQEDVPAIDQEVQVEVLVKGSFPDACSALHVAEQVRSGNLVSVELLMRKPRGAVCAAVIRPYRFYLMLEGRYAPGFYTLKINGQPYPFELRQRTSS
jgi:hypothetical protein